LLTAPRRFQAFTAGRLVLVGGVGAFRRSELAAIDCDHLSFTKVGLVIDLLRSKSDWEAAGRKVGVPFTEEEPLVRSARCAGDSRLLPIPIRQSAISPNKSGEHHETPP
jgi:hypothetical protein